VLAEAIYQAAQETPDEAPTGGDDDVIDAEIVDDTDEQAS
jgi:hypothetical protein